jgi:hypothetical protein
MNSNFYHVIGESDVTCLCIVLTTYESCIAVIWYKGNLPDKILDAFGLPIALQKWVDALVSVESPGEWLRFIINGIITIQINEECTIVQVLTTQFAERL